MYAQFFGLSQDPFSIAPDPHYLFMSEQHREALAHLLYGLNGGGGFVLLSGEVGTGKTTVCRCFLEQIPSNCNVAYIFNPKLTVPELLASICDEFHIPVLDSSSSAKTYTDSLNGFLLSAHAEGKNNVLIIDEAQNLSVDVLEQLRLLTNLETNQRKLLQIILIGQSELRHILARPELEQLAQRVIARFHLAALSESDTKQYITHRLAVASQSNAKTTLPFNAQALRRIHQLSRGVPRRINLLCGRALLGAYSQGLAVVDKNTVVRAAAEVFGPNIKSTSTQNPEGKTLGGLFQRKLSALVLGSLLLGLGLWVLSNSALVSQSKELASSSDAVQQASSDNLSSSANINSKNMLTASEFKNLMQANQLSENQAWQALGLAWNLELDAAQPCESASRQQTHCFSNQQTSLTLIRQLDRPGILTLTGPDQRSNYALLTGLDDKNASLVLSGASYKLPLTELAKSWRGDYSTLRRAPSASGESRVGDRLDNTWLIAQLSQVPGIDSLTDLAPSANLTQQTPRLRQAIETFQVLQGLKSDGQVGALTLMQLNRATGLKEPQLSSN
jgi:general secretion pathway protein A